MKEELVDVIVHYIGLLDKLDLNIDGIVNNKMDKNEAKYPIDKAKGSSCKYNKL